MLRRGVDEPRLAEAVVELARGGGYTSMMRLASVSVENYRSFVDPTKIEIRPLTLLFGYNSAGKSAAIRLLPILAASTRLGEVAPLALDSEAARGASFRDLLSRQSPAPTLKLGLSCTGPGRSFDLGFVIRDLPERQAQIVEQVEVRSNLPPAQRFEALWDTQLPEANASSQRYEFRTSETVFGVFPMNIDGLVFDAPRNQAFTDSFDMAADSLRTLSDGVYWLNSLRAVPPRTARFGVRPKRLAADGSNASDFLAHDSVASRELLHSTSAWFERATGHRLSVRRYAIAGEEQYSIMLTPVGAEPPVEIPIVDTGEGMAQVLPVIVLGSLARLGRIGAAPLLAIEHPELHLHPAAHADLAAFFCELTQAKAKPTIVLETHSENFLLRVQLAIARGEIPPADVVVHWIRAVDDGRSVVDTITFDAAARPQGAGWPPGVFAEDTEQARALLLVRKERELV
jgi:hypothetical protein